MTIYFHPLYLKCKKVIESCKTIDQLNTASNFSQLCLKNHYNDIKYEKNNKFNTEIYNQLERAYLRLRIKFEEKNKNILGKK